MCANIQNHSKKEKNDHGSRYLAMGGVVNKFDVGGGEGGC